ncbi:MAG: VWA domain-containing protein, partial [Chloroflexi bacterium]|nr:VWA domain-containing protein [Chloroflexota bacterium]
MATRYRYSEWDGSQELPPLDADQVLETLSDDLLNFGDLQHALRNMLQRGIPGGPGDRIPGLRDLLQRLRSQRRERLDRFDLGGVMEKVRRELEELLALERETIERPLAEAAPRASGSDDAGEPAGPAEG